MLENNKFSINSQFGKFQKNFCSSENKTSGIFPIFTLKSKDKLRTIFQPLILHKRKLRLSKVNKLSQVTEHEGGRTVQSSYSQSLLSSLYLLVAKKQLIDVHKIFLLYAQGQQLGFVLLSLVSNKTGKCCLSNPLSGNSQYIF